MTKIGEYSVIQIVGGGVEVRRYKDNGCEFTLSSATNGFIDEVCNVAKTKELLEKELSKTKENLEAAEANIEDLRDALFEAKAEVQGRQDRVDDLLCELSEIKDELEEEREMSINQEEYENLVYQVDQLMREKAKMEKEMGHYTSAENSGSPTITGGLRSAGSDIGKAIVLGAKIEGARELNVMAVDLFKTAMDKSGLPEEITDGPAADFFLPLLAPALLIIACDMFPQYIPAAKHFKGGAELALTADAMEKLRPIFQALMPKFREFAAKAKELEDAGFGQEEIAGELEARREHVVNSMMTEMGQNAPITSR